MSPATSKKKPITLKEGQVLLEDMFISQPKLVEDINEAEKPSWMLAKITGVGAKTNIVNENNRLYSASVFEEAIRDIKSKHLLERGAFKGQVDHPEWGPSLKEVAIKFTKLEVEKDPNDPDRPIVTYEGAIINNEPGKHLKSLLDAGIEIGMSTRGGGKVTYKKMEGHEEEVAVIEQYVWKALDAVEDPSNAWGRNLKHESEGDEDMKPTLESLKADAPELLEELEKAAVAKYLAEKAKGDDGKVTHPKEDSKGGGNRGEMAKLVEAHHAHISNAKAHARDMHMEALKNLDAAYKHLESTQTGDALVETKKLHESARDVVAKLHDAHAEECAGACEKTHKLHLKALMLPQEEATAKVKTDVENALKESHSAEVKAKDEALAEMTKKYEAAKEKADKLDAMTEEKVKLEKVASRAKAIEEACKAPEVAPMSGLLRKLLEETAEDAEITKEVVESAQDRAKTLFAALGKPTGTGHSAPNQNGLDENGKPLRQEPKPKSDKGETSVADLQVKLSGY